MVKVAVGRPQAEAEMPSLVLQFHRQLDLNLTTELKLQLRFFLIVQICSSRPSLPSKFRFGEMSCAVQKRGQIGKS